MLSVLPEPALLVQCADVTMVATPLLLTRELSVSVVESITLSSPGPAAGSQLCSHILHILLFITTLSLLFKMLLCSLFYSFQKFIEGPEGFRVIRLSWYYGASTDSTPLLVGWFLAGAHNETIQWHDVWCILTDCANSSIDHDSLLPHEIYFCTLTGWRRGLEGLAT